MKFYDYLIERGKEDGIEKNVVGAIILNDKNEILVMSRKVDDFMGGIDELPSGNMEKGENIYDALVREVKECLEIYNFNSRKSVKEYECHFCATACIVNQEKDKILFIHHKKLNKWLFVGGHIEEDENPEHAVLREVKEETNLDIELVGKRYPREEDYIIPFALQKNYTKPNHEHMDLFYVAIDKGTSKLKDNTEEIKAHRWFSKQEIESEDFDTFPEKKQMALDVLKMFE